MLNKKEFESIRNNLNKLEENREKTIQRSREMIKLSKQIIYALHRGNINEAEKFIKKIYKKKADIKFTKNLDINIDVVALQEYVEALCYYHFLKNNKIPIRKELKIDTESYLLGLCDLAGELVRKAVTSSIKGDFKKMSKIKDLIEEMHGEFLKFDLRNSELRKKSDGLKYHLSKLEDLLYDAKIKGKVS